MSDYLIKGETLTDIANAIRGKTGSTSLIKAQDFATEIEGIQTGGGGGDIDGLIEGTLTEVTSNATSIRQYAFYYCEALTTANFPNATAIENYAFNQCGALTNITAPNVKTISKNAFDACSSLTTANFPLATSISEYAFYNCNRLTTANFPNATSLSNYVFQNCYALATANFPNATSIGSNVFRNCNNLTIADFPNANGTGSYSFYYCYKLTTANFPNATNVSTQAFNSCRDLIKVIIGTNKTNVITLSNTNAFTNCYRIIGTVHAIYNPEGLKDGYIYVPASLVASYRTATNWVTYATQIMPWVATVEELANIDGTTYDHACVGEGVDSVEYIYDGDSWRIFR